MQSFLLVNNLELLDLEFNIATGITLGGGAEIKCEGNQTPSLTSFSHHGHIPVLIVGCKLFQRKHYLDEIANLIVYIKNVHRLRYNIIVVLTVVSYAV